MPKPDVSPSLANSLHHHSPGLGSSQVDTAIGSGGELHQNVPGKADHRDGTAHLTDNFGHRCRRTQRSEEHTSELQTLMRISYAVFCLKKKKKQTKPQRNI